MIDAGNADRDLLFVSIILKEIRTFVHFFDEFPGVAVLVFNEQLWSSHGYLRAYIHQPSGDVVISETVGCGSK